MKVFRIFTAVLLALAMLVSAVACSTGGQGSSGGEGDKPEATAVSQEDLNEMYEKYAGTQLMRGIWVTPRLNAKDDQEIYDAEYKKVKDVGVNMIFTYGESDSKNAMTKTLEACRKNGIKVMISLKRPESGSTIKANLRTVEKYDSDPAVIGYNMIDEPNTSLFENIAKQYKAIREICSPDKIIMMNFFPNYANAAQLGVDDSGNRYRDYLEKYFELADTDVVSFDFYPYRADPSGDDSMYAMFIANTCEIMKAANERGLPAWGFVQCGEWAGTRTPKLGELRMLSHFHLLFGLDCFTYFLYVTPINGETDEGFFKGMVEYDGTVRETYDLVRQTAAEIDAMKGVYLDYTFKGLMYKNIPDSWKEHILPEFDLKDFANVKDIRTGREGSGIICGCFEKDNGGKGLYLLNTDAYYNLSCTVEFEKETEYRVWGAGGIEQAGTAKEISFDFISGEGKFVEITD
ncbi:MAG: beta-galactosidase [Clostridia bacterium]|nr:beta-galactosidase [Clostridia bacterium]